jgi:uncharacterized protein YkwD
MHVPAPISRTKPIRRLNQPGMAALVVLASAVGAGCGGGEQATGTELGSPALAEQVDQAPGGQVDQSLEQTSFDPASVRAGGVGQAPAAPSGRVAAVPAPVVAPPTLAGGPVTTPQPATAPPAAALASPAPTGPAPTSVAPVGAPEAPPASPNTSAVSTTALVADADLAVGENRSLDLLNQLRATSGKPALVRDPTMDAAARQWSTEMAASGAFEHSATPYGENIAFTNNARLSPLEAVEVFQRLWAEDPTHLQNMNGDYTVTGIGVYRSERGWYGTHLFNY